MAELRELHNACICGGPDRFKCRRCQSKKYCSKGCQVKDWPLHKQQCSNEALLSSVIDNKSTNLAVCEEYLEKMTEPHWRRFLLVVFEGLRKKAGSFAESQEYYVYWLRIDRSAKTMLVAYVWLAQEPFRLFMHVSDEREPRNVFAEPIVAGEERPPRHLLDSSCIVLDVAPDRKPCSLIYPVDLRRPDAEAQQHVMVVDWDLRGQM